MKWSNLAPLSNRTFVLMRFAPRLRLPRSSRSIKDKDWEQFKSDGYMVIRDVIPNGLTTKAALDIAAFVGADIRDSTTWYGGPLVNDGLVPLHHAQSLRDIRQCPRLHQVFSEFWGTHRLMVDINRCCFRPPCHRDWPTLSRGEIHWDTDPRTGGEGSLQGIVLLSDVGRDAGGFQCLPDVYQNLETWLAEHAQREDFNFFKPGLNDRETLQVEGKAGDLILWSTRLPHGPAPNHSTKPRIAAFVSMGPPPDSPELRAQMKEWWSNKQAPLSWRGLPGQLEIETGPPAKLTRLGMKLIGILSWD
jgi:hypothetical protein